MCILVKRERSLELTRRLYICTDLVIVIVCSTGFATTKLSQKNHSLAKIPVELEDLVRKVILGREERF